MKRNLNLYIALLLIATLIFSFLTIYAFGHEETHKISVSAHSAVLYQPETNSFLYSKNSRTRMPMASTTKIMTALVALEESNLTDLVVIDENSVGIEGSSAYLKEGEKLTVEELLYALLLQSANDAAVAIACHISGDVDAFASLMNSKANSLGLSNTHFTNPHGLDNEEHYTTAEDLARIAAEALKNENFRNITSTYQKTFSTEERSRTYVNHNKLLRMYDGCIGVKTGFTKKSGRCLVAAAERDGLTFISVTLDATSDWNDHKRMLDVGFNSLEKIILAEKNEFCYKIPIINGESDELTVTNKNEASIITEKGDNKLESHLKLVRYAIAPVREGENLGEVIFTLDGKEVERVNLVATETVLQKKEKSFLQKLISLFN